MAARPDNPDHPGERFLTTHWSTVLAAADSRHPDSRAALEALCNLYWFPVYARVRHQGIGADAAQDLTQGFFVHLFEKHTLRVARPDRGRFRAFLKTALHYYLANEEEKARAHKRGSGRPPLALDFGDAEQRYRLEPAQTETPETLFEKSWARALLSRALRRLREEMQASNSLARFTKLEPFLVGQSKQGGYRVVAAELGMSESAVRVALHRMRRRFGALVRAEVAHTVDGPDQVDEEVRYLFSVLAAPPRGGFACD